MYDSTLTGPPVTISVPHYHPAGLDYNWRDGILAVPDFDADSVTFVDVNTPDLDCIGFILNDSVADGDGVAEAGETCELTVKITNHRGWASSVTGLLITDDPYVSILNSSTTVGNIRGWGQEALASTPFVVAIDPDCPNPYITTLELGISSAGDYARTDTILLYVGDVTGFEDDMDGAEQPWIDASPAMHTGHWHREDSRAHSGSYCWKMGDTGSAPYAGWVDARLVTPPFLLEPNSVLKFWHWIDAKDDVGASAVDGGLVMLLSGDSVWAPLDPVGGYPHFTGADFVHPLGDRTWCYSGTYDWSEAEFDLSAYSGVVQLMFRFGSGHSGSAEGWYIDDVFVGPAGNTGAGTNVVVEAGSGVTVTFEEVTGSGQTDVATADSGPQPPEGYAVVPSDPAVYYDITTTAGFNGLVEVCIDYSGDQVPEDESILCLFHYDGEPAEWLDVTTTLDTAGNQICGSVTSLSQFIVASPTTCCTGPTMGNVNCEGIVDMGDVTELIKLLFINVGDPFCCEDEADLDHNGDIDIGDLTILTARLFITVTDPPPCP
jgi:hypothetical protein